MVSQYRWSLVAGSIALKCGTFCQKYVVFQDRWSLMAAGLSRQVSLYCIFTYHWAPFPPVQWGRPPAGMVCWRSAAAPPSDLSPVPLGCEGSRYRPGWRYRPCSLLDGGPRDRLCSCLQREKQWLSNLQHAYHYSKYVSVWMKNRKYFVSQSRNMNISFLFGSQTTLEAWSSCTNHIWPYGSVKRSSGWTIFTSFLSLQILSR